MAKAHLPTWGKYPIVNEKHIPDLEYDAAIKEFGDGLPREEAEAAAYKKYSTEHHQTAAAHHLRGSKAAAASGDFDEARKHGMAFAAHMDALGLDPMDAVPDAISKRTEGPEKGPLYKFKSHGSDRLIVPEEHEADPEPKDPEPSE